MNNPWIGWAVALAALVIGWTRWGWKGVVVALTVIVFWLLLQFSRSLRALRDASGRPVGRVPSAVMLHARLHAGMRLVEILRITRSLGKQVSDTPEVWSWRDEAGDEVRVELTGGRISKFTLQRNLESAA